MDPDTQRLIEKARQRREMLNQRFAGMPEAAPRKRRTPVLDEDGTEKVLSEVQVNQDDSPKRQCVREEEQGLKPDTPAIRGVQSRVKDLPTSLTGENEENRSEEMPTPKPRKSISSPPLERKALPSSQNSPAKQMNSSTAPSRRGRFAALAQNINSWEDDLTHHVIHKEEEKKPRWQPPPKNDNPLPQASSGKGPAPSAPPAASSAVTKSAPVGSPKKTHAPPTPRSNIPASPANNFARNSPLRSSASPAGNLARNSPLRSSKVEWNRSPKPFTPTYKNNTASPSKSAVELSSSTSAKPVTPVKAASDTAVTSAYQDSGRSFTSPSKSSAVVSRVPNDVPVNAPDLSATPPSDGELNQTTDEPTHKPVSQRFAAWAEKTETPKPKGSEPSKQPLSAKLATFEKKIAENTPRTGLAQSVHVQKTQKQVCTPAFSASTPAAISTNAVPPKVTDPSELSVSQRMSQMQEKLTPQLRPRKDEPTAYSVSARMSAWETMTSSNLVSDIKKVDPSEDPDAVSKPRPVSGFAPKPIASSAKAPQNPPPPPAVKKGMTPKKSFKESIEERATEVQARIAVANKAVSKAAPSGGRSSPVKSTVQTPSKVIHSPNKVSTGTKSVQQRLVERTQDSTTTCSSMAAQIRAARMEELEVIKNRWKNGILRDDNSSSDESTKPSEKTNESAKISTSAEQTEEKPKTPGSTRREEARNKARTDFGNKLAEIGLPGKDGSTATTTPQRPPQSQGVASGTKPAPGSARGNQTSSIYQLIKKREEAAAMNSEDNKKVKFNDSFDDSDDDYERKIPLSAKKRAAKQASEEQEDFKKPEPPRQKEESTSDCASSSDVGDEEFGSSDRLPMDIDDDDISLKGFVSEAVRRESILPPAPQRSSQSSLDSYEDDCQTADSEGSLSGPSSKHGGYRPDDESMDDEENDCHAMDDLLDEAMDDTSDDYDPNMDPKNVVLRPKHQPREEPYDPDMDINNVVLRRKNNGPVPAQRSCNREMESTDDDDEYSRPYSLQAYRKSANVHQHMMEPIVRKSRYADRPVEEEDIAMPSVQQPRRDDKRAVQDRIKELQELVQQEQSVIMQTSNALNKCCMGNSYFAGSAEQVECNKLLLLACQKRQGYMTEIQRLKETGCLSHEGPGPQGSLTISDIRLPLKKEFVTKIGTSQDTTTHYFILLIRNGAQLICTQMLSTHDPMMRGSLDFPNLIKINGITSSFRLTVDIYSMSISKEAIKDKKKKTPKKLKGYAMTLESPGGPTAVRTTSFSHVTSLVLTMKSLDKNSFHLEKLPYLSPLYGQIFMRLKCLMEVNVEERGFLTMFDDVSGFGAWHRRWCVLSGNKLCVWKYPDDETRKDPMTIIDLKRCITEKVGLVPRDICARPNTFEMVTVRQPLKGEHDTLVTRTYNSTTTVRHQMSADSKEERIVWCNKINRTLANLRTWNADAVKPAKPPAPNPSYR